MATKEKEEIRICTCHDEEVPLIWTFAFNGSEYWCPACGFNGGMLGSGTRVELTKELKKAVKMWKKKSEEFLDAKSTLTCYSKEFNGKTVLRKDLPQEEIERCKNIVSQWKYEIE
jgi:hypothetical protein